MTHTRCKHELRPVHPVEHQSLQYSRLPVVIIEEFLEGSLCESLVEEDAAIRAHDADGDAVIHKLLSVLVFHHLQTVISHASHFHLIILVQPLDILGLLIFLHTDRTLRFGSLHTLHDNVIILFLLTATNGQHACNQHDQEFIFLHFCWFLGTKIA